MLNYKPVTFCPSRHFNEFVEFSLKEKLHTENKKWTLELDNLLQNEGKSVIATQQSLPTTVKNNKAYTSVFDTKTCGLPLLNNNNNLFGYIPRSARNGNASNEDLSVHSPSSIDDDSEELSFVYESFVRRIVADKTYFYIPNNGEYRNYKVSLPSYQKHMSASWDIQDEDNRKPIIPPLSFDEFDVHKSKSTHTTPRSGIKSARSDKVEMKPKCSPHHSLTERTRRLSSSPSSRSIPKVSEQQYRAQSLTSASPTTKVHHTKTSASSLLKRKQKPINGMKFNRLEVKPTIRIHAPSSRTPRLPPVDKFSSVTCATSSIS